MEIINNSTNYVSIPVTWPDGSASQLLLTPGGNSVVPCGVTVGTSQYADSFVSTWAVTVDGTNSDGSLSGSAHGLYSPATVAVLGVGLGFALASSVVALWLIRRGMKVPTGGVDL